MSESEVVSVDLNASELYLLMEGLDAYEYWQLGDVLPRKNGMVFLPDEPYGDRYWAPGEVPTDEQRDAIDGVRRCRELLARMEHARSAVTGSPGQRARLQRARAVHTMTVDALIPLLIASALAEVAEVLPGAASLVALGEINEDGLSTLRIQRVISADDEILYDVEAGHPDAVVEDAVDRAGTEYLDQLLDITYGQYFGTNVLERFADPDRT